MKLSRAGWAGLASLVASLVLFALTLDLKANPLVPIGPGFYPRIVLGLTAALALILADMIARTIVSPAELPIGIVTAFIGAPFFLWILLRGRSNMGL